MVFLVLAQGINILYGFTGYMPFGYVAFFGFGAYGCALSIQFLGVNPVIGVIIGGLCATALGLLLAPLLRLQGAYFAIASLAAAQGVYDIISNPHLTSFTHGPYGVNLGNAYAPTTSYWTMWVILILAVGVSSYLRSSVFGLSLMAARDDPNSAGTAGVNVVRGRYIAWFLSSLFAGLAGATFGWNVSFFYPDTVFSITFSIFPIVFAVFGGVGTVYGPLAGAAILYWLYNAVGITYPEYFQLLYGALIVGLVLFLPGGIVSLCQRMKINVF